MRNVLEELESLDRAIKKRIKPKDDSCLNNINLTQLKILIYLAEHNDKEVCQKDFEDFLKIKKASVTGALESMEAKGLIVREKSEDDARKKIVKPSQEVKERQLKVMNVLKDMEDLMLNNISDEDLNIFFNTIKKMRENVETIGI